MLLRLKVKNFLSFYEESTFDMFPNLKRTTFENHIYRNMEVPLLKQAAIYGANGSGKSNLLETIRFIKRFATEKDFLKNFPLSLNKFLLAGDVNSDVVKISVEFYFRNQYILYNVEIDEKEIHREELFLSGIGKKENQLIFSRVGRQIQRLQELNDELNSAIEKLLSLNPLSSVLSLNSEFPIIKNIVAKNAFQWFKNRLNVLSLRRTNPALISAMSHNPELLDFTNKVFAKIGLGIESIEIDQHKLSEFLMDDSDRFKELNDVLKDSKEDNIARMKNDRVLFCIEKEEKEQIVKRFLFRQIGINDYCGSMQYEAQSDGTARLLNLIPALFDITKKECVYCIDEIENSIHPSLMIALIKYVATLKTKGQLIFTTHETELLDQQQLMRPDEVWFAEKRHGNTQLYSLNDFKEHNTINIKNGYLEGRYGAIPFIGNLDE